MVRHDYEVYWTASDVDFKSSGVEKVWATDESNAKTRAKTAVSRKRNLARQLIKIESVETF